MKDQIFYFLFALITVSSAINITETFFVPEEWPCIQDCFSKHDLDGEIRLVEMVLPEFSLIFDICNALTTTQTCSEQCNYTNTVESVKPFAYLCDSATLSELQKHEVCYTDINNEETKTSCGERCGGKVEIMAERLHRVMGHHLEHGVNATDVTVDAAGVHNATVEACKWQKCYAKCSVDTIGTLCRDSDPTASTFMRKIYEELGYAHYDDLKAMGVEDVIHNLPEECFFMVEPSVLFDEHANTADPSNVNVEQAEERNEEEFWKLREEEEEQMWSACLKKCAADQNYAAEMDRFEAVHRGGDYADQFHSLHTMCRANEDLRNCLHECNQTAVQTDDMKLPNALCDRELFEQLQAHEECYSKSRDAKADCQDRCDSEKTSAEKSSTIIGDVETCRMRKCRMRCHYDVVVDNCGDSDPDASKFMLQWFDQVRHGASIFFDGEFDHETVQAVLNETPQECHYFLNKNVTLFDGNSSVRCSLTTACTAFLLLFVTFSFFNGFLLD